MQANLFLFNLLAILLFCFPVSAATLSRGQTFTSNETVTNTKLHNLVDLATITGIVNADINNAAAIAYSKLALTGSIVNADISASAAIAYSKLALTGAILNADLAGSIADSKLSQITTASKVHGSSITGLASVPSGAGVIPIANLATGTPTGAKFIRDDGTLQAAVSAYDAGTYTVATSDTARSFTGSTSYREIKSFIITRAGTISTTFDLAWTATAGNVYGRIYRNGSAVGTERQVIDGASDVYSTFTEDISGWSVGDLLQIYVKSDTSSTVSGKVKNFRIKASIPTVETVVTDTPLT